MNRTQLKKIFAELSDPETQQANGFRIFVVKTIMDEYVNILSQKHFFTLWEVMRKTEITDTSKEGFRKAVDMLRAEVPSLLGKGNLSKAIFGKQLRSLIKKVKNTITMKEFYVLAQTHTTHRLTIPITAQVARELGIYETLSNKENFFNNFFDIMQFVDGLTQEQLLKLKTAVKNGTITFSSNDGKSVDNKLNQIKEIISQ